MANRRVPADVHHWDNRIVGEALVDPHTVLMHPHNWRVHSSLQRRALTGLLTQVGWVQRVVVNQRTGHLLDGHLRVALAMERQETLVPVVYVDLSEDEEALVLVTFDPIGALAAADHEILGALLHEVSTGDAAVQELLGTLAQESPRPSAPADCPSPPADCPPRPLQWIVVIDCEDEEDQRRILAALLEEGYPCRALSS